MTNAMDTLLALKCGTCCGEKQILCQAASDGDCNWDKCPQGWDINAHCRLDIQDDEEADIPPCPDCHATGNRFWQLLKKCPGTPYKDFGGTNYRKCVRRIEDDCCHGTGFVPVSEDTALRVLLEWALRRYEVLFIPMGEHIECQLVTHQPFIWQGSRQEGATPLEALADAIKASLPGSGTR